MAHRYSLPILLVMAGLGASLAACDEDPTRPHALTESAEAESVMRSAAALPSLPELTAAATTTADPAQRAALLRAHELWLVGTLSQGEAATWHRHQAVAYATPLLVELLPAEAWEPLRGRIEGWIRTADGMLQHLALPGVEASLDGARRRLERADAATGVEDRVYHLMLAMSDLVETTPRFVARRLVDEAAAAVGLAEERAAGTATPASLRRARRLADWAARAAEKEDHVRAIQRAYYAIQLAEER